MARYLGVDYGDRRVGIAVSDESFLLAREFGILKNDSNLTTNILEIVSKFQVKIIVVGLPLSLKTGLDTEQTILTRDFAKELQNFTEAKVVLLDERFTTKIALSMPKSKKKNINKDSFAAQLILQSYLDQE